MGNIFKGSYLLEPIGIILKPHCLVLLKQENGKMIYKHPKAKLWYSPKEDMTQ